MGIVKQGKNILAKCLKVSNQYFKKFQGIGFVIVENKKLLALTLPLRPSVETGILTKINSSPSDLSKIAKTLVKLSTSKKFHDGFHILNKKLEFIGISRMLLVKKSTLKPNENMGTRYYAAKIFSSYRGVKFVGIISKDRKAFYFINGKSYKL